MAIHFQYLTFRHPFLFSVQVIKSLSHFKKTVVVLNAYSLTPAAKIEHGDKLNQISEKTTGDVEEKLNFHSCLLRSHTGSGVHKLLKIAVLQR